MANKTIWQEVMQEGIQAYGPPSSVAEEQAVTAMPNSVDENSPDGIADRLYKQLNQGTTADTSAYNVQQSQDGKSPYKVELPVVDYSEFQDEEQREVFSKVIPSEKERREQATAQALEKYGKDFLDYDAEKRRQILEYETEELLEAQTGRPADRSAMGTATQGFQTGGISTFSGNLGDLTAAKTGVGGRLTPPTSFAETIGRAATWLMPGMDVKDKLDMTTQAAYKSYSDLIPGFEDMEVKDRRKAIADWKQKNLDYEAVKRNAKQDGLLHGAAMFGGWLTDPTTAIPLGQSYKMAAASSGTIAGTDVFLYELATKGEINPKNIMTATALGAVGGPAMMWGGRKIAGLTKSRHYNKIVDKYEKSYAHALAQGDSKDFAEMYARVTAGNMSQEALDTLYTHTGRTKMLPDTPKAAKLVLEERASFLHRYEMLNKIGRKIEDVVTPISDRIGRKSTRIAHELRKMEMKVHVDQHQWFEEARPFFNQLRKIGDADHQALKRAILSEDPEQWGKAYSIIKQYEKQGGRYAGMTDNFDKIRVLLKEVGTRYKQAGFNVDLKPHYFPRVNTNPNAIKKVPYSFVQEALEKARKKKGGKLSQDEIGKIFEDIISFKPKKGGKVKTTGALRERTMREELLDYMMPHYADPEASLHSYLRMAAIDLNRSQFMRNFGYKGKFLTEGTDIGARIGDVVSKEQKRLGFSNEARDEVIELLQSRFTLGEQAPNSFIRGFKNLGYMTTLGNPIAAMTQLGDQTFAMYKAGVRNAVEAAVSPKYITKGSIGLEDAMQEIYADPSALKRGLDRTLRWGGFTAMDKFGKETILNGALRKSMKQLKTEKGQREFIAKWGRYFGNETQSLMKDIRNFNKPYTTKMKGGKKAGQTIERVGEMTDNMRLMLWHELSDVQPIALSEMPKMYLDHPNGRVMYMLKTFTIKQLDFMRREIFREAAKGNYAKAMSNATYFTTFWLAMNGAADGLKSLFTNDPIDINDNMVENLMQLTLWSRYSNDTMLREGVGQAVLNFMFPPTPLFDSVSLAAARGEPIRALEPVPVVGKVIYKRLKNAEKSREAALSGKRYGSKPSRVQEFTKGLKERTGQ